MSDETLRLANVLADGTRYSIYQHIFTSRNPATVHEIAELYNIHPNVARLHLTKLEDVNLLTSSSEKTGKGGRPSRVYYLSDQIVNLQFPPRDYKLLSQIAIESLINLGAPGQQALNQIGERFGREAAKQALQQENVQPPLTIDEKSLDILYRLVLAQGLNPEIRLDEDQTARMKLFNCPFKEAASKHPQHVCQMHHALIKGMLAELFGSVQLIEENSMISGCESCDYTIIQFPDTEANLS